VVDDPLLQGDDRVVGDVDAFGAALRDIAESEATLVRSEVGPAVGTAALLAPQRGTRHSPGDDQHVPKVELIAGGSFAKLVEGTPEELGMNVHAHPTLAEIVGEAAMAVDGLAIHF
jgi:hypothetical protein